jgi:hypothetical protein
MVNSNSPSHDRILIELLDKEFARIHERSCSLIQHIPQNLLYASNVESPGAEWSSIGENVIRCAAVVEQTCGGFTSNLWDDPFEWTLPETLSSSDNVTEYLKEAEITRQKTFLRFNNDGELLKDIATPSGELRPIVEVLVETLVRAASHHGQAIGAAKMLFDERVPGVII